MTVPEISVVIASTVGRPSLDFCLAALRHQSGDVAIEVIVVDRVGPSVTAFVAAAYPEVRLIAVDEPRSVPELRALGLRAARGGLIAITEDHCIPPPDWCQAIRRAHAAHPGPAIGGAVDNGATERLVDWAVFFCEYGNFLSPAPRGVVRDLPGPNVSYKRDALLALPAASGDEFWETAVHGQFEARGCLLWSDPAVRMLHKKHFTLTSFLAERFHYSRAFAGRRNAGLGPARRLAYLLLAPLLPPLLLRRLGRRVLDRRRYRGLFLRALPHLALFTLVWAGGEIVGYALGPGESALRLE